MSDVTSAQRPFAAIDATMLPRWQLSGRDAELAQLRSELLAAEEGALRIVVISGAPGVGKSALAAGIATEARARGARAARGKFDQFLSTAAFGAPLQAMTELCGTLLTEPEERLQATRQRLLAAIGSNVGLLSALVPTLAVLLGMPESVADKAIAGAQQTDRLKLAITDALKATSGPGEPLLLLLDDVQWADASTLALLRDLAFDRTVRGLFVVMTCRSVGLEDDQPFARWLAQARTGGARPTCLELAPLTQAGVTALVSTLLGSSAPDLGETARRIMLSTAGNPLHAIESVRALHRLAAGPQARLHGRTEAVSNRTDGGAVDVQSLLRERLRDLSASESELLLLAACAGGAIDGRVLLKMAPLDERQVASAIGRLIDAGLLEPVSLNAARSQADALQAVRISHDLVQAAVRAMTPDDEWKRTHLRISDMLAGTGNDDMQAGIHLAEAVELLLLPEQRLAGVRRLVLAAEDARRSAAFEVSLQLLALARSLQDDDSWALRFDETFALELAWHRGLSYLGRYDECGTVYQTLVERARQPLDLIGATVIEMVILQGQARLSETIAMGMDAVRRVAPELPFEALDTDMLAEWKKVRAFLDEASFHKLADAPAADDRVCAVADLLNRIADAIAGDPSQLSTWCAISMMLLWRRHGFHETMIPSTLHLGFYAAAQGEHAVQQRLMAFGLEVARARAGLDLNGYLDLACGLTFFPWYSPLEECLAIAQRGFERLRRTGNIEQAAYMTVSAAGVALESYATLQQVEQSIAPSIQFCERMNQPASTAPLASMLAFTGILRARPATVEGVAIGYPFVDIHTFTYMALASLVLNEPDELAAKIELARPHIAPTEMYYVAALATFAACWSAIDDLEAGRKPTAARAASLEGGMALFRGYAQRAPSNFSLLRDLLAARHAAAHGKVQDALASFDSAIAASASVSRPWQQALAVEHAGRFHLRMGLRGFAERLLEEARERYAAWGATRKAQRLSEEFSFLTQSPDDLPATTQSAPDTRDVDRVALYRASQALSSETDLRRLVERILAIVVRLTGATDASLLRRIDSSGWQMVGHTRQGASLPQTLVRYATRMLRSEAIRDLAADDRFGADPDTGGGPRSALVMPIVDKGLAHAILLLENSNVAGFFTSTHVDTVQLIAGQLSISLQNAELYQTLEMRVARRTEELQQVATALALRDRALESSSNGVHISELTPAGKVVVYVNPMLQKISGYEVAELIGSPIWALFGPEPDQPGARELRDAVEARRPASATVRCYRRDGSMFWNELSISPFQSAQGAVYFVGVHMDVTERVRAAEEEKRRTDRLRAVFELSPDGFVVLDSTATISIVNPAFCRMTGLAADDLLGRSLREFEQALEAVSVASGELIDRGAFAHILSGEPQSDVDAGMGEHGWLLTIAEPQPRTLVRRLRRAHSGPETVIYFRDVTRELEVDRMKSEFLSVAAHELRTPMTSIFGFSELLVAGRMPRGQQANVHKIIHRQSSALIALVSQLLDLARINAMQGANVVLRPTALVPVVREAIGRLRGIESSQRIVDALPGGDAMAMSMAMIDSNHFQLAVTNILSNALKYSSSGPVEVDLDSRETVRGRPQVGVRIRDRGIGMSPEELSRLFERFYRAHPAAGAAGTGLGATIVRDIMTAHKGEVQVASELGVGTVVTLWLDRLDRLDRLER